MASEVNFKVTATDNASATLDKIKNNIKKTGDEVESMGSKIKNWSEKNREWLLAIWVASWAVFASIVWLWKRAVQTAWQFEQLNIAFETMLGWTDEARVSAWKLIAELEKFSAVSPFEFPEVAEQAKQLMAYWVQLKDVMPTMQKLGDITALLWVDKLPRLWYALWQVHSQGRLLWWEFKQFAETWLSLWKALEEVTWKQNINSASVSKMNISYDDVIKALDLLTSKWWLYYQGMLKQATTFNWLMSTLSETVWYVFRDIWLALLPTLKELSVYLIDIATKVRAWVKENPELATKILLVAGAVAWLVTAIAWIGIVIGPLIAWLSLLISRPALIVIAVVALATAIYLNRDKIKAWTMNLVDTIQGYFNSIREFWRKRGDSIVAVFAIIFRPITLMIEIIKKLAVTVYDNFETIKSVFAKSFEIIWKLIEAWSVIILFIFNKIRTGVTQVWTWVYEKLQYIVALFSPALEKIRGILWPALDAISWIRRGAMDWLWNIVSMVWEWIKNTISSWITFIIDQVNKIIWLANNVWWSISKVWSTATSTAWKMATAPVGMKIASSTKKFAMGGVVHWPTNALIGEAWMSEAVVPLPWWRSIPVDMKWWRWITINIGSLYGTDRQTALAFANTMVSEFKRQFMFEQF